MPTSALIKNAPNRADVGIGPYECVVICWYDKFQFIKEQAAVYAACSFTLSLVDDDLFDHQAGVAAAGKIDRPKAGKH